MSYKTIPNVHLSSEGHAYLMAKSYMCLASTANDGTVFVPSPIAMVASKNLAICIISNKGQFIGLASQTLYANPYSAREKAKEMCEEYERMIANESV